MRFLLTAGLLFGHLGFAVVTRAEEIAVTEEDVMTALEGLDEETLKQIILGFALSTSVKPTSGKASDAKREPVPVKGTSSQTDAVTPF